MLSDKLVRWSKFFMQVGGIVLIVGFLGDLFLENNTTAIPIFSMLRLAGAAVMILGFSGVYAVLSNRSGALGLTGFLFTYFGFLLALAFEPIVAFVLPYLQVKAPALASDPPPVGLLVFSIISVIFLLIGGVLLGIDGLRARIASRMVGTTILVGVIISTIGSFVHLNIVSDIGTILFVVGLIALTTGIKQQSPKT